MNRLLEPEVQDFLKENLQADLTRLAFAKNPFPDIPWTELLHQIAAKKKAQHKLPLWFATDDILYPQKISIEQSSSEATAVYKASLVSGKSLIDLTGGFGVDDYYFAQQMDSVLHCELNAALSNIAAHNFGKLGASNITCIAGDSTAFLASTTTLFDWIYVDPSRRHDAKGKVFLLRDCAPNVPDLLDLYFGHAPNIMIKTAPLLDLTAGWNELKNVKAIHIVALENEVKELLWILERNYNGALTYVATNLSKKGHHTLAFDPSEMPYQAHALPRPGQFLFEPNAALMKAAAFHMLGQHYDLSKLHQHAHLYLGDVAIDFPGRSFRIEEVIPYEKAEMKRFEKTKANVAVRHFPESVEKLRQRWKITEGGDRYCFFTTDMNNRKIVLLCAKI